MSTNESEMIIQTDVRSEVLEAGTEPHPGWTVSPCRDCKGAGLCQGIYLCLHCGGAGYFQINPNYAPRTYTPTQPKCWECGSTAIAYTAEAWRDVWACQDCGARHTRSLGD